MSKRGRSEEHDADSTVYRPMTERSPNSSEQQKDTLTNTNSSESDL